MKALGKGSIASIVKVGLDIAWILLWIAAVAISLFVVAYTLVLSLSAAGVLPEEIRRLAFEGSSGRIRFDHLTIESDEAKLDWRVIVPAMLVGCVAVAGALAVVWNLKKLFRNFTTGEAFSADNANHMRGIWIALLVIELSRYAILILFGLILLAFGAPRGLENVDLAFNIDFTNWFMILTVVVLAEVFREGARLHEEQKLTI